MKKLLMIFLLIIGFRILSYTQTSGQSTVFERERDALSEEQNLDAETKKAILKRLELLYQPPLHVGIETGLGFAGTNTPDEYNSKPKISLNLNAFGTYYYDPNFAIQFSLGWGVYNGKFSYSSSMETEFSLNYFEIGVSQLFYYKEGFFYFGPKFAFLLKDKLNVLYGASDIYETNKVNIGITIGGGYRIDFLYKLRMHIGLEFNYFLTKWRDAPSSKWRNYSVLIKLGILYGLGSYKQ